MTDVEELIESFKSRTDDNFKDFYNVAFQDGVESVRRSFFDREKIHATVCDVMMDAPMENLTLKNIKDLTIAVLIRLGFCPPPELPEVGK